MVVFVVTEVGSCVCFVQTSKILITRSWSSSTARATGASIYVAMADNKKELLAESYISQNKAKSVGVDIITVLLYAFAKNGTFGIR